MRKHTSIEEERQTYQRERNLMKFSIIYGAIFWGLIISTLLEDFIGHVPIVPYVLGAGLGAFFRKRWGLHPGVSCLLFPLIVVAVVGTLSWKL